MNGALAHATRRAAEARESLRNQARDAFLMAAAFLSQPMAREPNRIAEALAFGVLGVHRLATYDEKNEACDLVISEVKRSKRLHRR